ncbi:hypothetical protein [Streptomyces spinosisporus]|uniref:Uncharacterized protein n=1 Tax=Streptomyces spinosisporus TaxID=2927582 RepID=A0ABS9XDY1_9ACTN|nr:hypothetical protein [Streptomyces spinosisporus]MCI3240256.1 hypothetical protein [Streptomyces spinosisporus]
MPEPTFVLPNPYSPYADADPLYRHLFPVFAPELVGDPAPGSLVLTRCERMTVVPTEPITYTDELDGPLPAGLCPLCIAAHRGEAPPRFPTTECRRCESTTRHNGLCAICRQDQHADWWQASDTWARPFRIVQGKRTLDGAVFPNGQAVIIDDPETGLSSSAESLDLLLTGYHRAEVMLAEDVIRVGTARVHHAAGEYARMAIDLADTRTALDKARRELGELKDEGDDCDPNCPCRNS